MLNQKFLDEVSAKLNEAMSSGPAKDFEKNARALLARARQKLGELEARVAALEAQRGK